VKRLIVCLLLFAQFALSQASKQLTIEAIFAEGGVTGRAPETVKWSPDGTKVSFVQRDDSGAHGSLWYVDVASGKKAVLVAEETLATLQPPISAVQDEREKERLTRYSVAGYHWAPDSRHLLFDTRGQLWLYSLDTGKSQQLTNSKEPSSEPKFSPDGRYLSFIRAHNIFVRDMKTGIERQLTKDGNDDLLNGEVDWLYAEELDVRSNYFWSPDSTHIVFLQTNRKQVPTYPLVDWVPVQATADMQKYPQPGDPNPVVKLGMIDVASGKVSWPFQSDGQQELDGYIPRFGFMPSGRLWAEMLDRKQQTLALRLPPPAAKSQYAPVQESEPKSWVEVTDPRFVKTGNGTSLLWTSWRDGHTHIYLYSMDATASSAVLQRQLTSGDFEVFSIDSVDEKAGLVYFTANKGDARQRHLYSVPLAGGEIRQMSREPGTHSITFPEKSSAYYVDNFSQTLTPPALRLCKVGGECTPFWQAREVKQFELVAPKFVDFTAADGTTKLHGMLYLPPNTTGKVPVILNPYGGPGGQVVRDAWVGPNGLFDQILLNRGFAILKVDNRGMSGRGKDFVSASRLKFGEVELADQIAALDQALKDFPQLDSDRVGFWGWSYGGFMTLYGMTHSTRFKAGVSVAPVSDWRLYDSTYTERFMGMPKENAEGYKKSSPVHYASNLSGHLLIVHGTGDDNVHMQNTMTMVNQLIEAKKPFDLQLYPRKTHGIAGSAARTHLFTRILDHFERYLK